jgi:chitodextrinase
MTTYTTPRLLGMACGLFTTALLATMSALGAVSAETDAAQVNSAASACSPAWSASTVYTGGEGASEGGVNYTAAYWTQDNNPAASSGPSGSGYPWISDGACGSTPTPPASSAASLRPTSIWAPHSEKTSRRCSSRPA